MTANASAGLRSCKLGLYEKATPARLSWSERLSAAREAGYDFVEISIDETDARLQRLGWTAAEKRSLIRDMDNCGIRIETMCLSGHRKYPLGSPDPVTRSRSLEIMALAIQLAVDLGIRIIQLAGYDTYYDASTVETDRWFIENLALCAEMASRESIILGFETMETPFMDTVAKAMHYVSQISSPYLQIYPDIGNLTNAALIYGIPVSIDLRTGLSHLAAAHLKETRPGHYREIEYGTGHTDFRTLVPDLQSLGVRRFTAEFWYTGAPDWRNDLHKNADFLRTFFV